MLVSILYIYGNSHQSRKGVDSGILKRDWWVSDVGMEECAQYRVRLFRFQTENKYKYLYKYMYVLLVPTISQREID